MKKITLIFLALFASLSFCFVGCEDDKDNQKVVLNFCYGGVNGVNAIEDPNCQIQNLRINGQHGLSYQWKDGKTMKAWGEKSPSDIIGLACAGYFDPSTGKWNVGKFDWISSSRLTRDFKNISTRYQGWEPDRFYNAKDKCFFIMEPNGKRRTNILFYKESK